MFAVWSLRAGRLRPIVQAEGHACTENFVLQRARRERANQNPAWRDFEQGSLIQRHRIHLCPAAEG
jgi:hypothetical protein